jgi:hypothetical protein
MYSSLDVSKAKSLSESELLYDGRFIANQFALAPSTLRITTRDFLFFFFFATEPSDERTNPVRPSQENTLRPSYKAQPVNAV